MVDGAPAPRTPHRMHLRGPWEYEWLHGPGVAPGVDRADSSAPFAKTGRVKLPGSWQSQFGAVAGAVRFRRHFHRPTNLEPHERVVIAFDGIGGTARVWLNGRALDPTDRFIAEDAPELLRYEITGLLANANELVVEIDFDATATGESPGGLWGPVAIEVW